MFKKALMDSIINNLPYQIPGPAGATSLISASQSPSQVSRSLNAHHFFQPQWHDLLSHLDTPPHGEVRLTSSIALLRYQTIHQKFTRFPKLAVLVTSLSRVGRDASVTLSDPSGSIRGTFHEKVFEKYQQGVGEGAALLLDDVAAVMYLEKKPTGFRMQTEEGLHVSVQARNVKAVFPVPRDKEVINLSGFSPTVSYEPKALDPPVLRGPPFMRVRQGRRALCSCKAVALPFMQRNKPRHKGTSLNRLKRQTVHGRQDGVRRAQTKPGTGRQQPGRASQGVRGIRIHEVKSATPEIEDKLATFNDDGLDEMLSAFDIEAAIEASGKSQGLQQEAGNISEFSSDLNLRSSSKLELNVSIVDSPSNKSYDSDFM